MSLSKADRSAAIAAAADQAKQDFAGEIARRSRLTVDEVNSLAKTDAERQALAAVIDVVAQATASNQAKAGQIQQISGGLEALIKIATKLV